MRPDDEERFRSKFTEGPACWEWRGTMGSVGYGMFWYEGRYENAHRIALRLAGVEIPDGLFVLHHCDNRPCVRPDHLYVGTHVDNMRDRQDRGRTARGDRMPHQRVHGAAHPKAKLTEADVRDIRRRVDAGETQTAVAHQYGIRQTTVSMIANRATWKHLSA